MVLYQSGLSMREISRRTGVTFGTVRHHLFKSGLHRIEHKRIQNGMATCNQCCERKTLDQFPKLTYGTYLCLMCIRAAERNQQLHKQGCSKEQFNTLFEAQAGKCAICGATEGHRSRYQAIYRLAIDHDHRTGKIRGLLCNNCNRGLGRFKDSIETLQAAISYLKREQ